MKEDLQISLKLMFGDEGGFVNNPKDPGGATKYGITFNTLRASRAPKKTTVADVKSLTLAEAARIADKQYWQKVAGDDLPAGLDYAAFDFAYNSGVKQAALELQRIVGVTPDGIIGAKTLAAVHDYIARHGVQDLIRRYCDARLNFMRGLKSLWPTFGRGWTRRVTGIDPLGKLKPEPGVVGNALILAAGQQPVPALEPEPIALADPSATAVSATPDGKAAGIAGIGVLGTACADAANQLAPYTSALPVLRWAFIGLTVIGIAFGLYATIRRIQAGNA